jgi:mycothiol conjugate amidase Mca
MQPSVEPLTLLAVHAHPDDEAIGTGGILAHYSGSGARVALVCATKGEVGEIVDPTIDEEAARPRLGQIREDELRCACGVLGVQELLFLGYRDSGMAGTPDNENPASFFRADFDEATGRLVEVIRDLRPQVVVTYDEKGGYHHPDHIMAHRITAAAFDAAGDPNRYPESGPTWQPSKLYYTAIPLSQMLQMEQYFRSVGITSPFERADLNPEAFGTPDEIITTRIDVREYLPRKMEALTCHRTQIAADSFFFKIPEEFAREGFGYEHFVRARSLVPAPTPENDLFAGLRG